ncbi:MAG TPA: gephyrin-like molybdotransferase Glp [Stellaceae bacterium]|nr:gephyrin-like molybdotransferase Glp [Stellaceae bacterium]
MAQLSDDCFAFGGALLPAAAALERIRALDLPLPETETVALKDAAGRILAGPLVAARDVPPYDNAAVDGYAVRFTDLDAEKAVSLPVAGRAAAGHPLARAVAPGEAVRIFTGAPMPEGPDTVLMQEDCRAEGGRVSLPPGIKRGANRRHRGEDVRAGDAALAAGTRLRPQEVALAAALGETRLTVYRRLRVALLSTGDEVQEPGSSLTPGAIYDANRYALQALLTGLGCDVTDLGIVPDNAVAVRDALATAAAGRDLVVTSGGVSTGEEDHVKGAVEALGRLHFWRLAIRPGRPVALGQIGGVPFIGLPGNPVAVMVTFVLLARPLILRLAGAREIAPTLYRVSAGFSYEKKKSRAEYLRARLERAADGALTAHKYPRDGAGIISSLVAADGLVVVGEGVGEVAPGAAVDFLPFREVLG